MNNRLQNPTQAVRVGMRLMATEAARQVLHDMEVRPCDATSIR
jgi:hypothetical protein